ncbi:UNKNOWN [Stylonychia lemnae]|uniref:Transmembrane protein 186 n=1 Tax=Stylonychia lemnae TaxID=5949 RepID=A0A077ZSH4_STYLE|nr:UNKNOWN [Stylonychia lemnae]|eukprot:CDW72509.1 UNKNOWN [Stylonychia lemnae]
MKEQVLHEKYVKLLENGRLLLLHHRGAGKYYRMNFAFLTVFLGMSIRNYYTNSAVFLSERFGKFYIFLIMSGMTGLLFFGNRHIRSLYLDLSGKNVLIETHTFFGLAQGREKIIPVKQLQGNRMFYSPKMNLYQLEYIKPGKWTKKRSFFYRPEYIADQDIWQKIRKGEELPDDLTHVPIDEEAEKFKKLKKKAEALKKFK